jgi:hypothetical protein
MAQTKTTGVRFDPNTETQLEEAVKLSGMPRADIIRWACKLGLDRLSKVDYSLENLVLRGAESVESNPLLKPLPTPLKAKSSPSTRAKSADAG